VAEKGGRIMERNSPMTAYISQLKVERKELLMRALKGRGTVLNLIGGYEQSKTDYLTMAEISSSPEVQCQSYIGISYLCFKSGKFDEALDWAEKSKLLSRKKSRMFEFIQSLSGISQAFRGKGEYSKALKISEQALKFLYALINTSKSENYVCKKEKLENEKAKIYANIAIIYSLQGKYKKSQEFFNKSIAICRRYDRLWNLSAILLNIGNTYNEMGEFRKALKYYDDALKIKEKIGDKNGISTVLYNIARALSMLGEYKSALRNAEESFEISKTIGDIGGVNFSLMAMGILYNKMGKYNKSLSYHQESLKIGKRIKDPHTLIANLINIGKIYLERGKYDKCKEILKKAEKIARKIKNPYLLLNLYITEAHLFVETDFPTEAYKYLKESLSLSKRYNIMSEYINGLSLFIKLIIKYGKIEKYTIEDVKGLLLQLHSYQKKDKNLLLDTLPTFIEYYIYIGKYKKALKYAEEFLTIVKEKNAVNLLPLAFLLISKAYLYTEENPSGYLKEARKLAEKMGLKPLLKEIEKLKNEMEYKKS